MNMAGKKLKVTKTIVNGQRNLIGFVLEGPEKAMGGFTDKVIERPYPTESLLALNFSNNQLKVVDGKFIENNNFSINSLPMVVLTEDGQYIPIDNTVAIMQRFVQDNENIGFRVQFSDGSEDNIRYANLIMLCKWFKPGNFAIRTSSLGKTYISGKKGGPSLSDFPEVVLGDEPKVRPKRMKSAAKETKKAVQGALETGYDILDIYKFIDDCNGSIINLPSEKYVPNTVEGKDELVGFTSLGIGEVASPRPLFSGININVNANFKKVGVVPVSINGQKTNLTSFVYRNKSIFLNGENHIKKFGIAVATEKEDALISTLGASLALEKITDSTIIQPLSQVIDAKSLAFYKIDTSKIDLISEKKRKASILSTEKLFELCIKKYELNLISKALGPRGGVIKDCKAVLGIDAASTAEGKKLFGIYSMLSPEALETVKAAGIDVYTGAFINTDGKAKTKKATGADPDRNVTIEYVVKGYDPSKLTGSKIRDAVRNNDTTKVSATVIKYVSEIEKIADMKEKMEEATKLYGLIESKIADINKMFWMHNASMYIEGNKSRIHSHDNSKWVPDTSSRVKNAQVYECNEPKYAGLTVKFTGVNI